MEAEAAIDLALPGHPLLQHSREEALLYVWTYFEDIGLRAYQNEFGEGPGHSRIMHLSEGLLPALLAIFAHTVPSGVIPRKPNSDRYFEARTFLTLAADYVHFANAFRAAHAERVQLQRDGFALTVTAPPDDPIYLAYEALTRPQVVATDPDGPTLSRSLRSLVRGSAGIPIAHYNAAIKCMLPYAVSRLRAMRTVPETWHFDAYSYKDILQAMSVILALSMACFLCRIDRKRTDVLGQPGALCILRRDQLIGLLRRWTGVGDPALDAIVDRLTYGAGVNSADPYLQPLIPLSGLDLLIAPYFVFLNDLERNHLTLLNRVAPGAMDILRNDKETVMRDRLSTLFKPPLVTTSGPMPASTGLPDLDFAVIDHATRQVLIAELKWFIGPSETRERMRREDELARGVQQALSLVPEPPGKPAPELRNRLGLPEDYEYWPCIISASWIGTARCQDPRVPIISEPFLEKTWNSAPDLARLIDWLQTRSYLLRVPDEMTPWPSIYRLGPWSLSTVGYNVSSRTRYAVLDQRL